MNAAENEPVGWYIRVFTGVIDEDGYDYILYLVGLPDPGAAEEAVRRKRSLHSERCEIVEEPVVPGIGPQPSAGEVRLLLGAK